MKNTIAILAVAGTMISSHSVTLPQIANAQAAKVQLAAQHVAKVWKHCSPNNGAVGPFFVIAPGVSASGLFCSQQFFSAKEAVNWACYRNSRGNGYWPQFKNPSYGMPTLFCPY